MLTIMIIVIRKQSCLNEPKNIKQSIKLFSNNGIRWIKFSFLMAIWIFIFIFWGSKKGKVTRSFQVLTNFDKYFVKIKKKSFKNKINLIFFQQFINLFTKFLILWSFWTNIY